jgi:hypothetical protein
MRVHYTIIFDIVLIIVTKCLCILTLYIFVLSTSGGTTSCVELSEPLLLKLKQLTLTTLAAKSKVL